MEDNFSNQNKSLYSNIVIDITYNTFEDNFALKGSTFYLEGNLKNNLSLSNNKIKVVNGISSEIELMDGDQSIN